MDCQITATPSDPGGTFAWSVPDGATLVDANGGGAPSDSTSSVIFRSFQPDNVNGAIPPATVVVSLQYTPPGGDAITSTLTVTVHAITFEVDGLVPSAGSTIADETAVLDFLVLQAPAGVNTIEVFQSCLVSITVDPSCTANGTCASNYQVGWLQTVFTNTRDARYNVTDVQSTVPLPIRDARIDMAQVPPFYSPPLQFTAGTQCSAPFMDSIAFKVPWAAPDDAANQLRQVHLANTFTTWLTVQNINWAAIDPNSSLLYLRNFSWSVTLDVAVDPSKQVGRSCTSTPNPCPTSIDPVGFGQGGATPVLTAPIADTSRTINATPAPSLP